MYHIPVSSCGHPLRTPKKLSCGASVTSVHPLLPILLALTETMSATLRNLEANYALGVKRYEASPSPARRAELTKKQILIDGVRHEEKKCLRWFTAKEIQELGENSDNWPSEPREPLALQEFSEMEPEGWSHAPKMVNYDGKRTMTLDTLLEKLQELRATHGGQKPVVFLTQRDYFECFENLTAVEGREDCIVFDNI